MQLAAIRSIYEAEAPFATVYLQSQAASPDAEQEVRLRFENVSDQAKTIVLGIYAKVEDHIVVRAIVFPYIRLLWLGTFVMLAGLIWSLVIRIKRARQAKEEAAESS